MKMKLVFLCFSIVSVSVVFYSCTKKVGKDPDRAYSDKALLDSAKNGAKNYYKNDPNTLLSGAHGPHGTFKLRFNSEAFNALTDNGKLPVGAKFPERSLVVKDVYKNGAIQYYAYMYKLDGNWLWGEADSDGNFIATTKNGPSVCAGCHSQTGHRDNVVAFHFY